RGPGGGAMGGDGWAAPAGTCNFREPVTFFAISHSLRRRTPNVRVGFVVRTLGAWRAPKTPSTTIEHWRSGLPAARLAGKFNAAPCRPLLIPALARKSGKAPLMRSIYRITAGWRLFFWISGSESVAGQNLYGFALTISQPDRTRARPAWRGRRSTPPP